LTTRGLVAVFGSSRVEPGSDEWLDAEETGARCARAGLGVVTGGYGGVMEAASKGAALAGGTVVGVIAPTLFPGRSGANPYVGEVVVAQSIAARIDVLTAMALGVIVLPGSIGTAAELLVSWNINDIEKRRGGARKPTVAVGTGWSELTRLLATDMGADPAEIETVATPAEAVGWLLEQPEILEAKKSPI